MWLCSVDSKSLQLIMSLAYLEVMKVRNLTHVEITPSLGLNVVYGVNASGKTSLLESISILGMARSFRTPHIKQTIQYDQPCLRVLGKVLNDHGITTNLGIERTKMNTTIRIAGKTEKRSSQLAIHLPIVILAPDSHQLIESGPRFRRQFLDWGVFHVEHHFLAEWQHYHRVLSQRNAALRQGGIKATLTHWDDILVQSAQNITNLRQNYLEQLLPLLKPLINQLLTVIPEIYYYPGWPEGQDFRKSLAESLERDTLQGYTQYGPHRADIRLEIQGIPVQRHFSRGQQKLLVSAMRLAQVALLRKGLNQPCLMLVDDLAAELDSAHRARLLQLLAETQSQIFISVTEAEILDISSWKTAKLFHVEHGHVREVLQ